MLEFPKNMIKSPLIWHEFSKYVGFDEMKCCVSCLCTTQTYISVYKKFTKIYDLILTPFSSFDIKCKNLIRKTSGIVFFWHLGEWVFHILEMYFFGI